MLTIGAGTRVVSSGVSSERIDDTELRYYDHVLVMPIETHRLYESSDSYPLILSKNNANTLMIERFVLGLLGVDLGLPLFCLEKDQGVFSYFTQVPFQLIRNQAIS